MERQDSSATSTSSSGRTSPVSSLSSTDTYTFDEPITVLASSRAVIVGRLTAATIVISAGTGKITAIFDSVLPATHFPPRTPYVDQSPHVLLPGLVDAHVHLNEPGRTEWEGFWTGTQAAAFGGVTTVIDMPLNAIPPTTTLAGLREKVAAAQGKCWVNVGFYGGIVPGNASELKSLVRAGVRGFKGFLIDSGIEEFPAVSSQDIAQAMAQLADEPTTLMFHAEMIPPITDSVGDDVQISRPPLAPHGALDSYNTFLKSRPPAFETYAIEEIISLSRLAPRLPLHIVHLSALEAVPILRAARCAGVRITAETCFHYLALAAEDVRDGDTRHKCCPPIRQRTNQDGLWNELLRDRQSRPVSPSINGAGVRAAPAAATDDDSDAVIRTVVSDHSPCTPNMKLLPHRLNSAAAACSPIAPADGGDDAKRGDFFAAWGGVSSVGLGLSILWTTARARGLALSPTDVARWCCSATAAQVGLGHRKGELRVGMDADIAVFDDEAEWTVDGLTMLFRNKCSPYEGKKLTGVVRETWVKGQRVFTRGKGFEPEKPTGELLLEPRTS